MLAAVALAVAGASLTPPVLPATAATPTCQVNAGQIRFTGQTRAGQSVQIQVDGWSVNPGPAALTFDWYVSGVLAKSGLDNTYTPGLTNIGQSLEATVTVASTSQPTCQAISPRLRATDSIGRFALSAPSLGITGQATVSRTLTAQVGPFNAIQPETVTYRWLRDGQPIKGATATTYRLTGADTAHTISLRLTAKGSQIETLQVQSNGLGPVQPGWFTKVSATVKGTARVGATLKAAPRTTGLAGPTSYSYQWLRNGKPIKGATKNTYVVQSKDVGKRLKVQATAKRAGFTPRSATSTQTKRIPKLPQWVDSRCMSGGAVICIDKNPRDRKVRYIVNGKVKRTFDARFGASDTPTREGVYRVFAKSRDQVSTLFNTAMPFAMFFSGGQAVHYSPDFAARGYNGASHGCVNIRDYSGVRWLFNKVAIGTKVVVYH
ncbi:MAG: L,D-transpeptidase [Bifidobacteriaceae bacterium]|jgi:lipoprotein-anchoring transpeptidase ErfK/SrfK|nr:L,D-transpeptidase [Bifidobacteriaceae bacterium]